MVFQYRTLFNSLIVNNTKKQIFIKYLILNSIMVEDNQEENKDKIIRKVWKGGNNQMYITIPKGKNISFGDYVEVKKV